MAQRRLTDFIHAVVFIVLTPIVIIMALMCDRAFGIKNHLMRRRRCS